MAFGFLIIIITFVVAYILIQQHADQLRHPVSMFYGLFAYHLFFFGVYYAYAMATASDSFRYYRTVSEAWLGFNWMNYYEVGTGFIEFVAFPFVYYLGFSYEGIMVLFAFFGFLGFFYSYLFFVERLEYRHKLFGVDFLIIMMFLPNMHFWTVSLGKGSIVFFGIGLFFYGLGNFTQRLLPLILGALIIFHVRSHILLVILIALLLSALFSSRGIKTWQKILVILGAAVAIAPVMNTFLEYAQLEDTSSSTLDSFTQHRAGELGKANSGVDLQNYNQLMKLFTFLFRPLFVDSPNAMGLMVSFENLLYLFLFFKFVSFRFLRYILSAPWLVKASLISFFGISLALAQISGNLGIAIRQKSQVMYLFIFVLIAYADWAYKQDGKAIIGE